MTIRTFQPGDEAAQVRVYNEAAAALPKFKPANLDEVRRRCRAPEFDPGTRFYAENGGQVVGYATFQANGRVSFPWCLQGHETSAEPLFDAVLRVMRERGIKLAFVAYRGDWGPILEFFQARQFRLAREMVNFVIALADMPTPAARPGTPATPLGPEDVAEVCRMMPEALRVSTQEQVGKHLLSNSYFNPEATFVLRSRPDGAPAAVGILVQNPGYADSRVLDSSMPCFRLGAFGTEGMTTKRINGLFSFLVHKDRDVTALGLDLLGQAAFRVQDDDLDAFAAQVPSDVPELLRFYERFFRKQGSFPVLERAL